MTSEDLEIVDGAEVGAWIAPRLEGGFGGKVEQLVPNGYEACVRVFHGLTDAAGNPATWAQVAASLGRVAHREMQWHRLIGLDEAPGGRSYGPGVGSEGEWAGSDPPTGEMDEATLQSLCAVLAAHSDDTDHCFFGLSTIHGGVDQFYSSAVQLRWRARDFVVFAGPLEAADKLGYESSSAGIRRLVDGSWERVPPSPNWFDQPPNLIWPADHSWFVQSEYDLDSTLVGGTRSLVDALLAAPELETWEVERGDSLEAWADKIN
ncbi:MAG: hypothetical protein JWO14_3570 [Solirubrobacterales bacterium]|nr:hypothetical protein [Solirubrobacterales bacterium]